MLEWIEDASTFLFNTARSVQLIDIIDIALVSILFYYAFKFVRDRRAAKLAIGVGVFLLMLILSDTLKMDALYFILRNVVQVGLLALIIVFQPELRSILEKMGGRGLRSISILGEARSDSATRACIEVVVRAAQDFSSTKTGALMVFERSTKLGDVAKTGTILDSQLSLFLLKNIFYDKAPLHDGAVIISGDRLYAAGCFLPLSENSDIFKELGTRHRAAIGISENSDAVVVVNSEETGLISLAADGVLTRGLTGAQLRDELEKYLIGAAGKGQKLRDRLNKPAD